MEYRTEELDDIILAACNGDGSAMIWLAKYYITKDIDPNSAKLWAHKAADSGIDEGNVVARQVFSVLAIADAELDEYELAYTEWMNVKWLAEDAQNRITFSVREREKAEFDRLDSIFGGAYAYFMSDKYKLALCWRSSITVCNHFARFVPRRVCQRKGEDRRNIDRRTRCVFASEFEIVGYFR